MNAMMANQAMTTPSQSGGDLCCNVSHMLVLLVCLHLQTRNSVIWAEDKHSLQNADLER